MAGFDVGGCQYRTRKLSAVEQWALLATLRAVLPALAGMDYTLRVEGAGLSDMTAALQPLMTASDDGIRDVFGLARGACERFDGGAWRPVEDVPPFAALMRLTIEVVSCNFAALFALKRNSFRATAADGPSYDPAEMPDGQSWLWRPVLRGVFKGEGLYDGTLRIEHIARANDALDTYDENDARARKASERTH